MSARNSGRKLAATRLLGAALAAFSVVLAVAFHRAHPTPGDLLYDLFLALNAGCGAALALSGRPRTLAPRRFYRFLLLRAPEALLGLGFVLFLFVFIYATNANMSYVQRFQATHGNIHLAPDSTRERVAACLQYLPLLALDVCWYLYYRIRCPSLRRRTLGSRSAAGDWALAACVLSAILYALSFPSFVRTQGLPVLGYVCLVPLLVALRESRLGWGAFYGTLFGVLQTMISNYWLGTFDLLSLQFVSVVTLLEYIPFMLVGLLILRHSRGLGFLAFPAAWTAFDSLRSQGFLGFPWDMLGTSQYAVLPLIQIASVTGVWGVTFLLMLCNSVIAGYLGGALGRGGAAAGRTSKAGGQRAAVEGAGWAPLIVLAGALALTLGWAGFGWAGRAAAAAAGPPHVPTVRLALIQQNSDPRKDNYNDTFQTLKELTNESLPWNPDLIVWSETAFVPNIRRWSKEDPTVYPLAALVREFLAYQKGIGRWLITGNDDYTLIDSGGVQQRLDYNGSVLFSPQGQRVETYHKIHLVPFTEYFPYKKQLPQIYKLLQSFDAYLWEPGDRRVVFHHPKFSFSTPICFEDAFPNDVREFVRAGAQVIVNLSNDYWSLTDTEAMQHAANAVFRAVENGVPLARASASGLTCLVNPQGRIVARGPFYQPAYLVVDVPVAGPPQTLYTRWGDWFPMALGIGMLLLPLLALLRRPPGRSGDSWPRRRSASGT